MRLISIFSLLLFVQSINAQILNPVKWSTSFEQINEQEFDLIITASIDEGWNVYSQFLEEGGPIPTSFIFEEGAHYEIVGKVKESGKKKEGYDDLFGMDVVKFYEKAIFTQRVKVTDTSLPIMGELEFMTCDDERCLPPAVEKFSIQVVAKKSEAVAEKITIPSIKPIPEVESAELEVGEQKNSHPVEWSGDLKLTGEDLYTVTVNAKIREGWHIYSQYLESEDGPIATEFIFDIGDQFELVGKTEEASPNLVDEYDDVFGMQIVKLKKAATFTQQIKVKESATEILEGEVIYMVCDKGRCLPPYPMPLKIDLKNKLVLLGKAAQEAPVNVEVVKDEATLTKVFGMAKPDLGNPAGECSSEVIIKESTSIWRIFILGFLGGLVALLTPCIFPMIPLTVSFFTKGDGDAKKSGVFQATSYGFFILLIYVLLSIPFHLLDSIDPGILNQISTNPILNLIFFAVFVFFAFSFFGYYELTLPSSWTNRASGAENIGGLVGTFFMALTLALVSFSCTGPILGSLLAGAITSDGGAWQLTAGMAGFGLALALPFSLFAAFPSWMTSLPRSGGWLNSVKVILGFVELALALKFLSNADLVKHWGILKIEPFLILWILTAVGMSLYMFGKIKFPHDSPIKKIGVTRIALGTLFMGAAIYLATGFMYDKKADSYRSLKLLSGIAPPVGYSWFRPSECPQNLNCFKDLKEGMKYAKEKGLPVMIDFTGYACFNCRKMEEHVWPTDPVYSKLRDDYVLVSLYVDDRKELTKEEQIPIMDYRGNYDTLRTYGQKWTHLQFTYFNNNSQPYYVLLTPEGNLLNNPVGYTPDENEYASFLDCGLTTYKKLSAK